MHSISCGRLDPSFECRRMPPPSFSPDLYRQLVQPVDRMIAGQFACNFIHLHSTSMFMLDALLEIEELRCFEINIESFNIPVKGMIEYFKMVQDAGPPLVAPWIVY